MADSIATATESLLTASRALVAIAARSLADVEEVTLPQYRALVVLAGATPVTAGDLANALDVHPSTATRLCDRLERKQLLRRSSGVQPDRRETMIELTAKGRTLLRLVTARRRRDLAAIVAAMSPSEREDVVGALSAFTRAAGELPGLDPFAWVDNLGTAT